MAAPTDSRQGPGTLLLGAVEFGAQASAVTLSTSVNSEDGTPTLGNPEPAPDTTLDYVLKLSAIQDWEDAAGLVNYLYDNALTEVAFSWTPKTGAGPTFTGTCQIVPMDIGGDVAVQSITDVELPCVGKPTRTAGAELAASGRSRKDS